MSISSHIGIILLIIVGMITTLGIVAVAAVETRRMEKGQSSILSGRKSGKAEEQS